MGAVWGGLLKAVGRISGMAAITRHKLTFTRSGRTVPNNRCQFPTAFCRPDDPASGYFAISRGVLEVKMMSYALPRKDVQKVPNMPPLMGLASMSLPGSTYMPHLRCCD